jgi:S-formylglutathione hydrolase FrmB
VAVLETHLYSEVLGMDTELYVIYPNEHDEAPRKTLWLLHGSSGDSSVWLRNTAVEQIAGRYNIVVVMPDGMYSCFTDMHRGGRYTTYITAELPSLLRGMFPRLSAAREDNYLSGYSNGGYGTFLLGMTDPYIYGAIGAFSAGNKAYADYPRDGSATAHQMYIAFGETIRGSKYDIEPLISRAAGSGKPIPRVYHACGEFDPALKRNYYLVRDFFRSFEGNPFEYVFHEYPGLGHVWPFWEAELRLFLGEYLRLPEYVKPESPAQTGFCTPWNSRNY